MNNLPKGIKINVITDLREMRRFHEEMGEMVGERARRLYVG